ncbi:MAG: hypothetical protein V4864_25950 [Pseudomonadota bacterium]
MVIVLSLPGIVLTGWLLRPIRSALDLAAYADGPARFGAVDTTGWFSD